MPEITAAEVLAFLQSAGVKNLKDVQEMVAHEKEDAAIEAIAEKMVLPDTKIAAEWQTELFGLADRFRGAFQSQEKNVQGQGTGKKIETLLTIELDDGSMFRLQHWTKKS